MVAVRVSTVLEGNGVGLAGTSEKVLRWAAGG